MSFQKVNQEDTIRPEGKTCILVFGYDPIELNAIQAYASDIGVDTIVEVKPDSTYNTLKQLIDGTGNVSKQPLKHTAHAIVLNAVSSAELNQFVHNFRSLGLSRPLFAMVTPTSINWKFQDLIEDLLEEKAMFEKMRAEQANK